MEAIKIILLVFFMGVISCQAQADNKSSDLKKEKKEMNLLDEQTKMFGGIFELAGAGDDNAIGGAQNYLELIEKMNASEELKQQLKEMYKVYDLSLDSKKKDSLKLMVDKMLQNAMKKTQNNTQQ